LLDRVCAITGSTIKFSASEHATLTELKQLLQPFCSVTEKLEAEFEVTSSQILPNIIGLRRKVANMITPSCTSVKTGLIVSMDKRFSSLSDDAHYVVSAALDPKFKLKWCRSTEEECKFRKLVIEHCEQIALPDAASSNDSTAEADDDLLGYMNVKQGIQGNTNTSISEVDLYLATDSAEAAASFWNISSNVQRFPRLYQLHLQHHCIPATSAAMERVFSSAGYIVNPRRSRLSDELLEQMLIAKCNKDLLP
jgi:hypothetical protein